MFRFVMLSGKSICSIIFSNFIFAHIPFDTHIHCFRFFECLMSTFTDSGFQIQIVRMSEPPKLNDYIAIVFMVRLF